MMDQLPGEILEQVFLLLNPFCAINFGLCSIRLQGLLVEPVTFNRFLNNIQFEVLSWDEEKKEVGKEEIDNGKIKDKEEFDNKDKRIKRNKKLMKKIVSFITRTSEPGLLLASLYTKQSIQESLEGEAAGEIFRILSLLNKYQIPELVAEAKSCLHSFKLTMENLCETAATADKAMSTKFDKEGRQLQSACLKFLRSRISGDNSVRHSADFLSANEARLEAATKMLSLMKDLYCFNCGFKVCKHGDKLYPGVWRSGLGVRADRSKESYFVGEKEEGDRPASWIVMTEDYIPFPIDEVEDSKIFSFCCNPGLGTLGGEIVPAGVVNQ